MSSNELAFVSLLKRFSRTRTRNKIGRETNGLLFKITGESAYDFDGKKLTLKEGQILLIPKGKKYSIKLVSSGDSQFMALNFLGYLGDEPRIFTRFNKEYITEQFNLLYAMQTRIDDVSARYRVQSIMYDIMAELTESEKHGKENNLMNKIKESFDYLHSNILSADLEIDNLGGKSGVSNAYFRYAFKEITGISPKKYVTDKRMKYAKNAIKNGDYYKMSDLALSCGYNDPLYFGKVFKSYFKVSPKKYAENVANKNE